MGSGCLVELDLKFRWLAFFPFPVGLGQVMALFLFGPG